MDLLSHMTFVVYRSYMHYVVSKRVCRDWRMILVSLESERSFVRWQFFALRNMIYEITYLHGSPQLAINLVKEQQPRYVIRNLLMTKYHWFSFERGRLYDFLYYLIFQLKPELFFFDKGKYIPAWIYCFQNTVFYEQFGLTDYNPDGFDDEEYIPKKKIKI